MSRNFEVQIEVFPCAAEQSNAVAAVLAQWGMTIEGDVENFDDNYPEGWAFWGTTVLAGGQTEEERHEELRQLLPGHHIISRWRYVDELPWDSEYFSEPFSLSPAA